MASKITKKGNHEPTKYFEDDGQLNATEKLTEQKLTDPQKLNDVDIENLTSKFLMNKIYYKMATKKQREQALNIAAGVILEKGREIKNKIDANDLEAKNQGQTTSKDGQPKGGKADIPRISGGTLSEVIAKINEMLAGKSGAAFKTGADNFAAMIETLATPEVGAKFDDVMKFLAKDPVLVVGIGDVLKGSVAGQIFAGAVDRNFTPEQKQAVSSVGQDILKLRNQENASEQVKSIER
jgi:hypothetical protein